MGARLEAVLNSWTIAAAGVALMISMGCQTSEGQGGAESTVADGLASDATVDITALDAPTPEVQGSTSGPWCSFDSAALELGAWCAQASADEPPVPSAPCDLTAAAPPAGLVEQSVTTTVELEAAVAAASGSAWIRLAPGVYDLTSPLQVNAGTTLIGSCAEEVVLIAPPGQPGVQVVPGPPSGDACPTLGDQSAVVLWGVTVRGGMPAVEVEGDVSLVVYQSVLECDPNVTGCGAAIVANGAGRLAVVASFVGRRAATGTAAAGPAVGARRSRLLSLTGSVLRPIALGGVSATSTPLSATDVCLRETMGFGVMVDQPAEMSGSLTGVSVHSVARSSEGGLSLRVGIAAVGGATQLSRVAVRDSALGVAAWNSQVTGRELLVEVSDEPDAVGLYMAVRPGAAGRVELRDVELKGGEVGLQFFGVAGLLTDLTVRGAGRFGVQVGRCLPTDECGEVHTPAPYPSSIDQPASLTLVRPVVRDSGEYGVRVLRDDVALDGGSIEDSGLYGVLVAEDGVLRMKDTRIARAGGAGIVVRGGADALDLAGISVTEVAERTAAEVGGTGDTPVRSGLLLHAGGCATLRDSSVEGTGLVGVGMKEVGAVCAARAALGDSAWLRVVNTAFADAQTPLQLPAGTPPPETDLAIDPNAPKFPMPPGVMPVPTALARAQQVTP